jgi:hypothetical protein
MWSHFKADLRSLLHDIAKMNYFVNERAFALVFAGLFAQRP